MKAKEDPGSLTDEKNQLSTDKEDLMAQEKVMESKWKEKLATIGNIVHTSVPTSMDEVGVVVT